MTENRGGRRKGAGRRPKYGEPTQTTGVRIPYSMYTTLQQYAKKRGKSMSDVIVEVLRKELDRALQEERDQRAELLRLAEGL